MQMLEQRQWEHFGAWHAGERGYSQSGSVEMHRPEMQEQRACGVTSSTAFVAPPPFMPPTACLLVCLLQILYGVTPLPTITPILPSCRTALSPVCLSVI